MPEKTRKAIIKAWKGLKSSERKEVELSLARGLSVGGLSSAILLTQLSPDIGVKATGITIGALTGLLIGRGVSLTPKLRKISDKFERLFKKHRGKTLKQEHKRLQRHIVRQKLKKVL